MTDEPKELTLTDIDQPIVAIVAIRSQREAKEIMPQMHLPYYQVTIDPGQCRGTTNGFSPARNFYRFGYAQGDELTGWQPVHEIEIFEVVAEVESGETLYPNLSGDVKGRKVFSQDQINRIEEMCLTKAEAEAERMYPYPGPERRKAYEEVYRREMNARLSHA